MDPVDPLLDARSAGDALRRRVAEVDRALHDEQAPTRALDALAAIARRRVPGCGGVDIVLSLRGPGEGRGPPDLALEAELVRHRPPDRRDGDGPAPSPDVRVAGVAPGGGPLRPAPTPVTAVRGADGALTLPLCHGTVLVGWMVLRPTEGGRIARDAEHLLAPLLAVVAATIHGTPLHRSAQRVLAELEGHTREREVVATAVGVLMVRHRCGRRAAADRLRRTSAVERRPVTEVAEDVIAEVAPPAEGPRPPPG